MNQRIEAPPTIPPTVAQQIFTIGSAIAGGLAGLLLAKKFATIHEVPTPLVATATIISVAATFGAALYLVNKVSEHYG